MKKIIEFNHTNITQQLNPYFTFRKSYGLITASTCNLPIVSTGFVVKDVLDESINYYLENSYGNTVMCRVDTPFKQWGNVPRGRDILVKNLNLYFEEIKKRVPNFILLCFMHTSIFFTGKFIERWKIFGGVNVLIIWNNQIIIEYVGKGFDVGDLSRGVDNGHQSFSIDWDKRNLDVHEIWEKSRQELISKQEYEMSRSRRKETLIAMDYANDIIEHNLPNEPAPISYKFFESLYSNCIKPVIRKQKIFNEETPLAIQINAYSEDVFHVFEIWEAQN